MNTNSELEKKEDDNDYMLNVLLKENNKLKQLIKNMAVNNSRRSSSKSKSKKNKEKNEDNSNVYNTILSMLEVLSLQREKITAVKKGKIIMLF